MTEIDRNKRLLTFPPLRLGYRELRMLELHENTDHVCESKHVIQCLAHYD